MLSFFHQLHYLSEQGKIKANLHPTSLLTPHELGSERKPQTDKSSSIYLT